MGSSRDRWGLDDPLKTIPPSRHPFQFLVMFALGVNGFTVLTQDAVPGSITDLVAPWAVAVWGATMTIGGVLAIGAAFWPDRLTGLLMERIALTSIGSVSAIYSVAVIDAFHGTNGYLNAGVFVSIAVACIWRFRQVRGELRRLVYWIDAVRESKGDSNA